jgi:hypothetical protein
VGKRSATHRSEGHAIWWVALRLPTLHRNDHLTLGRCPGT